MLSWRSARRRARLTLRAHLSSSCWIGPAPTLTNSSTSSRMSSPKSTMYRKTEWRGEPTKQTRVLRSDFLLVTFPGLNGRMSFRDVFEVDSRAVRDASQADRLVRLFGDAPPDVVRRAREITEASAGYHLAHIETDPFVAMGFLQAVFRPRFRFQRGDGDSGAGPNVSTVRFEERQRPRFSGRAQTKTSPLAAASGLRSRPAAS